MSNLLRTPQYVLGDEETNLEVSLIDEIMGKGLYSAPQLGIIPADGQEPKKLLSYSHGLIPTGKLLFVDSTAAIVQLITSQLQIEEERVASRQMSNLYLSKTGGYYKSKRDAAVILNKAIAYSSNGFPAWMDMEALQKNTYGGV
jgi:hypothetical protein